MRVVTLRRWLLLLALMTVVGHSVSACAGDTALNPQPLPPSDDRKGGEEEPTGGEGSSSGGNGSSGGFGAGASGSSSSGNATTPVNSDAGASIDAGDGGTDQ